MKKHPRWQKMAVPVPKGAGRGFNLVELLAVMGIVAVLIGLAAFGIQRVRGYTQMMKCASNLHQVGAALSLFVNDNHGHLPARYRYNPDVGVTPALPQRYWTSRLLLGGYIDNPDVLYCPSVFPYDHRTAVEHTGTEDADISSRGGLTYGMRRWAPAGMSSWGNNSNDDQPIGMIENPSNFFLVATSMWVSYSESGRPTQAYSLSPAQSNQRIYLPYQGRANVLFADFHVELKGEDYFHTTVNRDQAAYNNNQPFTLHRERDDIVQ